ncbi:MAG: hypothetical protein R3B89_35595 [Polyangiaceae bacterium]
MEVWPQLDVVAQEGIDFAQALFTDTVQTFAEYADDETLRLVPGHAYFLDPRPDLDEAGRAGRVAHRLEFELLPLLRDYLDERMCGSAADAIAGLADRVESRPGACVKRGRTQRGRERATRGLMEVPSGRPLIEAVDHGPSVRVEAADVGATGDRWVEPF